MMKNRLQTLWDDTIPHTGPAPVPETKKVLRRVDAALGEPGARRRRAGRPLRLAVAFAAALMLLAGAAVAAGQLPLPENNVLDAFFAWGDGGAYAASLVSAESLSVEDEHFSLTVTSSVADENEVYLTLEIFAKTEEAQAFLRSGDLVSKNLFHIETTGFFGGNSKGIAFEIGRASRGTGMNQTTFKSFDEETDCCKISADLELGLSRKVAVSLEAPTGALELKVPVKPIRSVKLRLNAAGPGAGCQEHAAGGPVEIRTVTVSPLHVAAEYTTPFANAGQPLFYFLWKDGTWSTQGQLHVSGPSGSMSQRDDLFEVEHVWKFGSVQDITKMEAIVFNGVAYPLDGGEPCEVDVSELPTPFAIPMGTAIDGSMALLPLSALCEGLGIPFDWDGERAVMRYRDVEVTVTAGSAEVQLSGLPVVELRAPAVFQDGELWAAFSPVASPWWDLSMRYAMENGWTAPREEKAAPYTYWLVTP